MKHLLGINSLCKKEIMELLNLADQLKYEKKNGIDRPILKGKTIGLIYKKPSACFLLSTSCAVSDLGGSLLKLSNSHMEIWRKQPIEDTVRLVCRYLDCLIIKDLSQEHQETVANLSSIPVINGSSSSSHPLQALAALMTIREKKGYFKNRKLCIIGGGPIAASLIIGAIKMDMEVCITCPSELKPDNELMAWAMDNGSCSYTSDAAMAVEGADVIYVCPNTDGYMPETNVYQVNQELLSLALSDALVMHPLPAARDVEIASDVFEAYADEIFDEAENILHIQKAALVLCMKGNE